MAQDTRKPSTGTQSTQSGTSGDYSFRCKDAGHNDCNWETRGRSEDEVLRNVEPHARERHNIQNFDENTRNKVRGAIRRSAA
jgi:predicted small metal-binding protein